MNFPLPSFLPHISSLLAANPFQLQNEKKNFLHTDVILMDILPTFFINFNKSEAKVFHSPEPQQNFLLHLFMFDL